MVGVTADGATQVTDGVADIGAIQVTGDLATVGDGVTEVAIMVAVTTEDQVTDTEIIHTLLDAEDLPLIMEEEIMLTEVLLQETLLQIELAHQTEVTLQTETIAAIEALQIEEVQT